MPLRDLNRKPLPMFVVATIFCVVLYSMVREHCGLDRLLIGDDIQTFLPSEGQIGRSPKPSDGFYAAPEVWGMERHPTNSNLYYTGPLGPDGRVIRKIICDRLGLVRGEVREDGSIKWRGAKE